MGLETGVPRVSTFHNDSTRMAPNHLQSKSSLVSCERASCVLVLFGYKGKLEVGEAAIIGHWVIQIGEE